MALSGRSSIATLGRLASMAWVFLLALCDPSAADEPTPVVLEVTVSSGRAFTGAVDVRSDGQYLWLRTTKSGTTFVRRLEWSAIQKVRGPDGVLTVEQARENLVLWRSTVPRVPRTLPPSPAPTTTSEPAPIVRTVAVDARTANWDADVESDGLLVDVRPLDGQGELVACSGHVEFELIGVGPGTTDRLVTFPVLGRWVRPLTVEQLGPNGLVVKLEFQADHPEFNLQLSNWGTLHTKLVVPGHGVFEVSQDLSDLRRSSPLRDLLQQQIQGRFLPQELTGRGKIMSLPANAR